MMTWSREAKFVASCIAAAVVLIIITAWLAPRAVEKDSRPTTYNTGPYGVKAAYLALARMGYDTQRWQRPATELSKVDAKHTTLIVAGPERAMMPNEAPGLRAFVMRGGWILASGYSAAYTLLPDGPRPEVSTDPCKATPEGLSAPAHIQKLTFDYSLKWKTQPTNVEFAQSCGDRAAVLLFHEGLGTVVVWSQSKPMTNDGLKEDANLRLLLASLGPDRHHVLFDEYTHSYRDYLWSQAGGTPVHALEWQLLAVAALIVLSFGRRHGPLRELLRVPRTSPLEFAHSMGNVYHRAGAGEAAVEEAQRRLLAFLQEKGGISKQVLEAGPKTVAQELREKLAYEDPSLPGLLDSPHARMNPGEALRRVQALHKVMTELRTILNSMHSNQETRPRA